MSERADTSAKIAIINQHSVNVGDEAAGYALIERLVDGYRIQSIDVFYNGSEAIPCPQKASEIVSHDLRLSLKNMGYIAIAVYLLAGIKINAAVKEYCTVIKDADVVFVAPGGANIGIYKDWRYLVRLLFAVKVGKTPIFHWNTIGASGNKPFDFLARKALTRSKLYVREKKSCDYLDSIGLRSELGPDTAFLLKPIPHSLESKTIAFVPSELDSWHPYYKQRPINDYVLSEYVPAVAQFAQQHSYKIEVIPHLRDDTERHFNEEVCRLLKAHGCDVTMRDDIDDFRDYDSALANADVVVGMRYHTAVLAAKNHRPFIVLAYENKALEVARYTGMSKYSIDLNGDRGNGNRLLGLLEEAEVEKEALPDRLREVCENSLIPRASFILEKELSGYRKRGEVPSNS